MSYIDGYLIPIKKKKVAAYKKMAMLGKKIWMEHGAVQYFESVGTKLDNPWGLGFKKMCKLKADETVIFAFVIYKSKAQRDKVTKKVMTDPRMKMEGFEMPFDMKRFSSGEFKVIVEG